MASPPSVPISSAAECTHPPNCRCGTRGCEAQRYSVPGLVGIGAVLYSRSWPMPQAALGGSPQHLRTKHPFSALLQLPGERRVLRQFR